MNARINLITLGVKNLEAAIDFYEKGLGWQRAKASQDSVAFFQLNGIVLSLYSREALAEDAQVPPEGQGFSGITLAYNTKSDQEVNDIIEEVKKLGATITKTPQKVFWGGYSAYFKDLDGHLFEVAHNPFFDFDERDILKLE
ncbi:MAG: glyoxalase [Cytophagaceae bacterium]|jgi:catechol 2,3-dioxygenase-like lactoylglutathione lyase family enzyme|nr:glyoxalase [Cytophagaceae bacterium]